MATSKVPQVLQLTPDNEILFEGPFHHVVTSYLELHNPSDKRVCFKVKTTAPRRYCVRPNSGLIEPSKSIKISIMLQPVEKEDAAERSRHKFMVQSTFVTDEEVKVEKVWETANSQEVMDSKLRCVFRDRLNISKAESEGVKDTSTATKTQTTSTTTPIEPASNEPQKVSNAATPSTNISKENTSRNKTEPLITSPLTSTPSVSASKNWGANISSQNLKKGTSGKANVSMGSASTSSFLQPINDDYKMVLVSLVMLFIGVILGKYIM